MKFQTKKKDPPPTCAARAAQGYDGRSVDVWASGILLLVMLLGSFPFDHTEHPDPNTSEAHLEVRGVWGGACGRVWGWGAWRVVCVRGVCMACMAWCACGCGVRHV